MWTTVLKASRTYQRLLCFPSLPKHLSLSTFKEGNVLWRERWEVCWLIKCNIECIWRASVLGTSFHCLSVDNITSSLTQIITCSFVTGGGTDGTVMEKMDVDDDAVVDLSVKYVHWYLSEFCQMYTTPLLLGIGVAKTFVEHTVYLAMMALLETHFHCNPLKNCSLINWQLQTCEI